MQDRIKEHDREIRLARTGTSAVSEHAHNTGHKPLWNEVKFIDRDLYYYTRRVKEAIHIRLHPNNINRDSGIEIPEAWMPTIKKHNNRRAVRQRTAEGANHWSARIKMHQSEMLKNNKSQQLVFTTAASFIQVIVSWSTVTRGEAILLLFDNLGVNVSKLTINELANIADVKSTINLNCSY